ncbi:unnamed protein product [Acanthoscelides obtectus]|uniref:Uncharacterized protein n=1 Tax=Acanthoscelides obtectus TaxID=200917 RepID=A0A9P0MME1_ACAOB|nr:unnamed protein product [Acanthoscelides obtectus]CAK1643495.1 hypothetical protein AOBTE_LOCUS13550 [Acanthoscelides obtectus]
MHIASHNIENCCLASPVPRHISRHKVVGEGVVSDIRIIPTGNC